MFKENNWMSIGIKPRAKDLKSVIEDFEQMEYLKTLDDMEATVVLDGKKLRIGFESTSLDPFSDTYYEAG